MRNPFRSMSELYSPRIQKGDGLWSVATRESLRHPINVTMNIAAQKNIDPYTQNGCTTLTTRLAQAAIMVGGTTLPTIGSD